MTDAVRTRSQDLALAIRHFVAGEEELARLHAYQAARDAMAGGAGLLDVVGDHREALSILMSEDHTLQDPERWADASWSLLAESLGSFEMALRGFQEANETLIQVNRDLERQVVERRAAEAAAETARDEADRANRAKSEFLSRMSHELRTPLNAILGFAQLLGWEQLPPDQQEGVDQIARAGRHLLGLINEVLDIARIESGRLALAPEPVPVDEVIGEILDLVGPLAADRSVTLRRTTPQRNSTAEADPTRLRQVLLNLMSNAIKYNREGGSVEVSSEELPGDRIRIAVADTGRGIDTEHMERLFSPFDRLGAEETDIEGTGLGLAVSMALVEAMGGRLEATSEPGIGSIFAVELHAVLPVAGKD